MYSLKVVVYYRSYVKQKTSVNLYSIYFNLIAKKIIFLHYTSQNIVSFLEILEVDYIIYACKYYVYHNNLRTHVY